MCQKISGIAVLNQERTDVKVYTSKKSDSHTDIRAEHGIRDDNSPIADRQTPIELIPKTSLTKLDGMKFIFDDCCPDWWTDNMTDSAIRQLFFALKDRWDGDTLSFDGDLDLRSLTSIPEGVTLSAGGYLDLERLTSIPEGVITKIKGNIYLKES